MFYLRNYGQKGAESSESLKFNLIMEVGGGLVWGGLNWICCVLGASVHELVTMWVSFITWGYFLLLEDSEKQRIRSWDAISRGFTDLYFWWHFKNCQRWLLALSYLSACLSISSCVRPSVCVEQLTSHHADFHWIWYLSIFLKSLEKIQVLL